MARTTGSPNKNKTRLLKALQKEYGEDFNPIMKIAKNATMLQAMLDKRLQAEIDDPTAQEPVNWFDLVKDVNTEWGRMSKFVTPELKAVEMDIEADVQAQGNVTFVGIKS